MAFLMERSDHAKTIMRSVARELLCTCVLRALIGQFTPYNINKVSMPQLDLAIPTPAPNHHTPRGALHVEFAQPLSAARRLCCVFALPPATDACGMRASALSRCFTPPFPPQQVSQQALQIPPSLPVLLEISPPLCCARCGQLTICLPFTPSRDQHLGLMSQSCQAALASPRCCAEKLLRNCPVNFLWRVSTAVIFHFCH